MSGYCYTGFSRDSFARPGDLLSPKSAYLLIAGSTYEGRLDAAAVLRPAAIVRNGERFYRLDPTTLRPLFSQYEITYSGKERLEAKTSRVYLAGNPITSFWDKYLSQAISEHRDWQPVHDASYLLDHMRGVYIEENDEVDAWEPAAYYHTIKKRAYQRGNMDDVPASLHYGTGNERTEYRLRLPDDVTIKSISAHALVARGKKGKYYVPILRGFVPQVTAGQSVKAGRALFKLSMDCEDTPAEIALIRRIEKYSRLRQGKKTFARADMLRWVQTRCLKCLKPTYEDHCDHCVVRGNPVRAMPMVKDFRVVAGKFKIQYLGGDRLDVLPDIKWLEEVQSYARRNIHHRAESFPVDAIEEKNNMELVNSL